MSSDKTIDAGVYRDIGELNGQMEMLRERTRSIESKVDESEAKLMERIDALQEAFQKSIKDLDEAAAISKNNKKLIAMLITASAAGGTSIAGAFFNIFGA